MAGLITITGLVGGSNSSGTVTKNVADGWGTAGYTSVESITGDGYIEWTATESNTDRVIGLSTVDTDLSFNTIEFGWYLESAAVLDNFESGASPYTQTSYVANTTTFRIAREGTQIKYYKNGLLEYTSAATAPVGALFVDTAIYQNGATIPPITMSSISVGGALSAYIKPNKLRPRIFAPGLAR